jgi:glucokinase-like ROK family protein
LLTSRGPRQEAPLLENELQSAIFRLLVAAPAPVSRAELGATLGFGRNAVGLEVRRLLTAGLLEEAGYEDSRGGRRSLLLRISRRAGLLGAVDLGATSIDVALTTLSGELVAHVAEASDIGWGPKRILRRALDLMRVVLESEAANVELRAVGIGVPGPVDQAEGRVVAPPIMPGWNAYPVRAAVSELVACPVFVDNDVNLMALGEHARGAARGVDDFIFVKIGTGIGAGIVAGGDVMRGADGCAGDLGHVCVDVGGRRCSCGNRGCLEIEAAGPAIARAGEAAARRGEAPLLAAVLEEHGMLHASDVGEAASRGDLGALAVVRTAAGHIGLTLASVVSLLNPSLVVIGGGVSRIGDLFLAEIRTAVYRRSLPLATRNLPIVMSELGTDAGVVGASVLAARGLALRGVG